MLRIAVVDDERQLADMIKRLAEAEFAKIHGSVEIISYTSPEQMIVAHLSYRFMFSGIEKSLADVARDTK